MKFKTQKEVKEEVQDENKSNPIHEYLKIAWETRECFRIHSSLFECWKDSLLCGKSNKHLDKITFKYYGFVPQDEILIKYIYDPAKAISYIHDLFNIVIEQYNNVYSQISPHDRELLRQLLPWPSHILEAHEMYESFRENEEEAKKKYCKCE